MIVELHATFVMFVLYALTLGVNAQEADKLLRLPHKPMAKSDNETGLPNPELALQSEPTTLITRSEGRSAGLDAKTSDLGEAIRSNHGAAESYYNRGLALTKKGDLDKAISEYSEAIRIDPGFADAYYCRGFLWSWKREWAKA